MLHYSLAKLGRAAGRAKGTKAELPPVQARLAGEKEYYAALRSMLAEMARETRESIIPLYQLEIERKRAQPAVTVDAEPNWFNRIGLLRMALVRIASNTVDRILNLEGLRHTENFMAAAKRALGIDIRAVVRQEDIEDYVREAIARNTSLITGLSDDLQKRIEQAVYDNSIAGNSVKTLRKTLMDQFGIADRRAKLIARDQMGKFNSDLNRIRQTQAGVTSYVWSTSHDERVRERHRKLDGKTYKWGEATGAEQGLPPGQPVQCRCIARGVVEF
ncbi:phage minor head protein [Shinella sp. DD12]|uniref:phage head morphogenesis protein n=1 Tax=Shinella sp. DD12 TaxID=1410620 RepID=UPI0003C561E7|nr:phage minor head protein [Shinella sp. DD12]EYR81397.1 putative head morphogenesis protein [Shinella sp. DD12]